MENIIILLLKSTISGSFLIIAVILFREFLKKSPRSFSLVLWALCGIRLIFPFSVETDISLAPSLRRNSGNITLSVPQAYEAVNESAIVNNNKAIEIANPSLDVWEILFFVWISGFALMLIYLLASGIRISFKLRESVCLKDNIYLCDRISSPFVFGVFKPRIYLPSNIRKEDIQYVIAHEISHIKHFDYIWKYLGFIVLSVHWFNPFLWLGFGLFSRDLEFACDERVIKKNDLEFKKTYSNALINCSAKQPRFSVQPLSFGELSVKSRIKRVLKYKKPNVFRTLIGCLLCCLTVVCFMTEPKAEVIESFVEEVAETPVSDFEYRNNYDRGITILEYKGNDSNIVIPKEINGRPVTEIGENAFRYNLKIASVSIPDTVVLIDDHAFCGCTNLKNIELPKNLEIIGRGAFVCCDNLEDIEIPETLKMIGENAFLGCDKLGDIALPIKEKNNVQDDGLLDLIDRLNNSNLGYYIEYSEEN